MPARARRQDGRGAADGKVRNLEKSANGRTARDGGARLTYQCGAMGAASLLMTGCYGPGCGLRLDALIPSRLQHAMASGTFAPATCSPALRPGKPQLLRDPPGPGWRGRRWGGRYRGGAGVHGPKFPCPGPFPFGVTTQQQLPIGVRAHARGPRFHHSPYGHPRPRLRRIPGPTGGTSPVHPRPLVTYNAGCAVRTRRAQR